MNWKKIRKSSLTLLLLSPLVFYFLVWIYDTLRGGGDGIISEWYYHRVFIRVLLLVFFFGALVFGIRRLGKGARVVLYNVFIFAVLLVLAEAGAFLYSVFLKKEAKKPSHILVYDNPEFIPISLEKDRMWGDLSDSVGRWRIPNKEVSHVRCSDSADIVYSTNAIGSRDRQRLQSGVGRVIFLGDSFIEDFLSKQESMVSKLLEDSTEIEHLNFGITGANPTAYYMIYKHLAKPNFEHSKLMVGVFPRNDFETFDSPVSSSFLDQPMYRPFWSKEGNLKYTLADRRQSYAYFSDGGEKERLRLTRDSVYKAQGFGRKILLELQTNSYLYNIISQKGYELAVKRYLENYVGEYEKPDWGSDKTYEFVKSFDKISEETGQMPKLYVIIPDRNDINKFKANGVNNFTPFMQERYAKHNVQFIDLMVLFASLKNPEDYFISCDGHWNEAGNRLVADYILGHPEYKAFMAK